MGGVNEGLSSDFFSRQYPRLAPVPNEEYVNSPKRERTTTPGWQEHWHGF